MEGHIMTPVAVLVFSILCDNLGYLFSATIVLMGGLVNSLIAPGFIEGALIAQLQALFLQQF